MKKITLLICSLFIFQGIFSQGIYESYIIMDVNGGGSTYYDLNASTGNTDFNGNNFGVFSTGNTLYLKGFEQKVWQANDGATGFQWAKLYYKVEETSDNSQSFSNLSASYDSWIGGNNHKWLNNTANVNLLDGLAPGNYKITVYGQARDNNNTDVYDSNSGSNYIATFSIINYSSDRTISTDDTFADVVVDSGVTLTISAAGSLNVTSTLTNNGTIVMQSSATNSAALVTNSIAGSGTYSYQKYAAAYNTTNDLIAPPFFGLSFTNTLANNSGVIYTNPSDNTQYLFGPFDNNTGAYLNYDSDTDGGESIVWGKGYRVGTASGGSITFTGSMMNGNGGVNCTVGSHGTYGKWNLIGNPYPSYVTLSGFFDDNLSKLASGFGAIYAYDGDDSDGSNWTEYNVSNYSGVTIAPGQAFFVAVDSNETIVFNASRKTTSGGDDFISGFTSENDSHIKLTMFDGNQFAKTDIYMNQNATTALDHGYDAGTFANTTSDFALYSTLADQSDNTLKLAIQAIPQNFTEVTSIPLGINSDASSNMNISIENAASLQSIYVYLKDYETGELTLLNDEPYSFSIDAPISGADRFELRISNFTMSNQGLEFNNLIFKAVEGNEKITFVGDFQIGDSIEIYDFLGKRVFEKNIDSESSLSISKNSIESGFYIANLIRNCQSKTIKFVNN